MRRDVASRMLSGQEAYRSREFASRVVSERNPDLETLAVHRSAIWGGVVTSAGDDHVGFMVVALELCARRRTAAHTR